LKICRGYFFLKDITDNFIALISHGITLLFEWIESATSGFSSLELLNKVRKAAIL
jgi:hypothetical protein